MFTLLVFLKKEKMNIKHLFLTILAVVTFQQISPHNSIHSMKHGKFKDSLSSEQKKIIDQHYSTFKTTSQAFENGYQGLGNRIGNAPAKLKIDENSNTTAPSSIDYTGTLAFTDELTIDGGTFSRADTNSATAIASVGPTRIQAYSTITNMDPSNVTETDGTFEKDENNTTDLTADNVKIDADNVVITGKLTLTNSTTLTVTGNLTVNAITTSTYINIGTGSTLTIEGNILFDGKKDSLVKSSIYSNGEISSTGSIEMINNDTGASIAIHLNSSSTTKSTNGGNITLSNNIGKQTIIASNVETSGNIEINNNRGTDAAGNVNVNLKDIKTTGAGTITVKDNDGDYMGVNIQSTIESDSGTITFEGNNSGIENGVNIMSGSIISNSGNIIFNGNSSESGSKYGIRINSGKTVGTTTGHVYGCNNTPYDNPGDLPSTIHNSGTITNGGAGSSAAEECP